MRCTSGDQQYGEWDDVKSPMKEHGRLPHSSRAFTIRGRRHGPRSMAAKWDSQPGCHHKDLSAKLLVHPNTCKSSKGREMFSDIFDTLKTFFPPRYSTVSIIQLQEKSTVFLYIWDGRIQHDRLLFKEAERGNFRTLRRELLLRCVYYGRSL